MLLVGLMLMGFWLFLVGGLQARFGHWDTIAGAGKSFIAHSDVLKYKHSQQLSGSWRTTARQLTPSSFVLTSLCAGKFQFLIRCLLIP